MTCFIACLVKHRCAPQGSQVSDNLVNQDHRVGFLRKQADDRPYNAVEQKIAAELKGNEQHRVPNRGWINPKKLSADYTTLAPSRPYSSPTFKINFPKFSPLYNFCSVSGNVSNP